MRSNVRYGTIAFIIVQKIFTRAAIIACDVHAIIDVYFTIRSSETFWACAIVNANLMKKEEV